MDTSLWNLGLPTVLIAGCGPIVALGETDTDGSTSQSSAEGEGPGSNTSPSTTASTTVSTATTVSTTSSGCVNDYECPPGYSCIGGKCYYDGCGGEDGCCLDFGCYYECYSNYECPQGQVCQYNSCVQLEQEPICESVPFGLAIPIPTGGAESLAFIDLGTADRGLLVGSSSGVTLARLDGSVTTIDNQSYAAEIAVRDLDADGDQDVVVADYNSVGPRVLWNDGSWTAMSLPPAEAVYHVETADVEGDGFPDVVGFADGGPSWMWPNHGPEGWGDPQYMWDATTSMARASLDGDGFEDTVVHSYATIAIYGGLAFNAAELYAGGSQPPYRMLAAGHFNQSAEDDVVGIEPINGVTVVTMWPGPVLQSPGWWQNVWPWPVYIAESGDLNQDGYTDVVGTDGSPSLTIGWGGPEPEPDLFVCVSHFDLATSGVGRIAIGDFTGDGRPDLALTDGLSVTVAARTD
ncbi:MAG: VCBS repeat-containing protein [Nannocystaceae bacterium]